MLKKTPKAVKHSVELLRDIGFKVTDIRSEHPMGNFCILLKSDDFWARLILDKGQEFVKIKFNGEEQWMTTYHIRKIIQPETSFKEYQYNFDKDTQFIKDNYSPIKELFFDENIVNTKKTLKRLFNLG